MFDYPAPSFPLYVTLPICGVALIAIIMRLIAIKDANIAFLTLSLWFRYAISNFHEYTYLPLIGGQSVIALSSLMMVVAGIYVLGLHALSDRRLLWVYTMMGLSLISALLNEGWVGGVSTAVKWLFLALLVVAAYRGTKESGPKVVFSTLALSFVAPLFLQWLSAATDLSAPNYDGVKSYIGGYEHQQSFAIIVLTYLFVTCCSTWMTTRAAIVRVLIAAAGVALANYRTAILASVVPCLSFLVMMSLRGVPRQQRMIFVSGAGFLASLLIIAIAYSAQERFTDIGTALEKGASLIQPSDYFTFHEQRLFSGRPWIWSLYIEAFNHGPFLNKLIGQGPEAWVGRFTYYAHNTFVATLYELGVLGVIAITALLLSNWLMAMRASVPQRATLLAFHFAFLFLNFGTLPFWTLEGDILFALLMSQTWWYSEMRSNSLAVTVAELASRVGAGLPRAPRLPDAPGITKATNDFLIHP